MVKEGLVAAWEKLLQMMLQTFYMASINLQFTRIKLITVIFINKMISLAIKNYLLSRSTIFNNNNNIIIADCHNNTFLALRTVDSSKGVDSMYVRFYSKGISLKTCRFSFEYLCMALQIDTFPLDPSLVYFEEYYDLTKVPIRTIMTSHFITFLSFHTVLWTCVSKAILFLTCIGSMAEEKYRKHLIRQDEKGNWSI